MRAKRGVAWMNPKGKSRDGVFKQHGIGALGTGTDEWVIKTKAGLEDPSDKRSYCDRRDGREDRGESDFALMERCYKNVKYAENAESGEPVIN